MRINVLHHAPSSHLPTRAGDLTPVSRNLDPKSHPFAKARERARALNAAKVERMFSKPLVGALEGHIDAVYTIAKKPGVLNTIASGSGDGEIIVHDLPTRTKLLRFPGAHRGVVSGMCFVDQERLLSCGVDQMVKLWDVKTTSDGDGIVESEESRTARKPVAVFPGKVAFNGIDHHRYNQIFATASEAVHIWDENKSAPISTLRFPTSTESITALKFNWSEASILASTGTERTFTLYDIRTGKAERRLVLTMRANALSWSPTMPTAILLASEDHNLYTFDIRSLKAPKSIFRGHAAAVMSCDWSPTGAEFVSGSWDRTVRIWDDMQRTSRDVYHAKRMQRVFASTFTNDAKFVLTGSDDGNVRIWKARASERLGYVHKREEAVKLYRDQLRERWKQDPDVGRINRHRHLPRPVYSALKRKQIMLDARQDKKDRLRKHKGDTTKTVAPKVVIVEQE
ncbi:rRNA-processing protein sof1 [Tulasnella sp. JGI-2019a]|nr:rRNA-processing protein sof1 [Tulasnella sp. JGI-2019a]